MDFCGIDTILKLWFFLKIFKLSLKLCLLCYFFGMVFKLVIVIEDMIYKVDWDDLNEE